MMTRESTNMSKSVINEGHGVPQIVMMRRDEKVIWQVNLVWSFHQRSGIEPSIEMTMVLLVKVYLVFILIILSNPCTILLRKYLPHN